MSIAELLEKEFPPSSEARLEALSKTTWSPEEFVRATRGFASDSGFELVVAKKATELVGNWRGMRYSYNQLDGCRARLEAKEALVVALVLEAGNVVGYGYAELDGTVAHIDVIEVEDYSTRSSGLSRNLVLGGETFSVGVGHVVVDLLMQSLDMTTTTDATNDSSKYIFRSLGFSRQPGEPNPCLLWFQK